MKKLITLAFLAISTLANAQEKEFKFEKYGQITGRIKVDGLVKITDTILKLRIDIKGEVTENTFKIVAKNINGDNHSYNCTGQVGTSDKHQFLFVPGQNLGIWTMINSFTTQNETTKMYFTLSKN